MLSCEGRLVHLNQLALTTLFYFLFSDADFTYRLDQVFQSMSEIPETLHGYSKAQRLQFSNPCGHTRSP
jgi:hypothetical protein